MASARLTSRALRARFSTPRSSSFSLRPFQSFRYFQSMRSYASDSKPATTGEEGSGIQKQTDKNARPVILEHAPPLEESEDVKKHNEEFEHRPDRANNRIPDEDQKVDQKVGKDFWKGQGGADRQS